MADYIPPIETVNRLLETLGRTRADIIPDAMVETAREAARQGDRSGVAKVLGELFDRVAQQAAGHQLDRLDGEEFAKKITWLTAHQRTDKQIRNYLAHYAQSLAEQPMTEAVQQAAIQGDITEVVREAEGAYTCDWCLERCGVWDPYDANAYGVWAKHDGCDCRIYVRKEARE